MPLPQVNIELAKKCPNPSCGSEKRATTEYIQELKKQGYLPKNYDEDCLQMQIPFMVALQSPANLQQVVPMLFINYAVCGECYMIYATKITSAAGKVGLPPGTGQPPGGPLGPMNFPQMKG